MNRSSVTSDKATPFVDTDSLYQAGALIIETLALLRLVVLAASALRARGWWKALPSLQSQYRSLLRLWTAKPRLDQHAIEQLDWLRCKMTCRLWDITLTLVIVRMVVAQMMEARRLQRLLPEIDFTMLFYGAVGLLLNFKPSLINPRSLDVWYVGTSLIVNLTLLPAASVEVRDILVFSFPWRFLFAVLAKRTWCFLLCTLVQMLQFLWMSTLQAAEGEFESGVVRITKQPLILVVFFLMFLGVFMARGLLEENALLKKKLQGRTVELGAVSSLLTACYDAVLEAPSLHFEPQTGTHSG